MEKLAVIHLGSSKVNLTLAYHNQDGNYVVFHDVSEPVKIVDDFDGEGLLRMARSNEALVVLKMFRMMCEVNKVSNIYAVGSHSLKTLKNYRSFLDEIYNITGFKFRILEENEELSNLYCGVVNSLDIPKGIIFNISGGSTRIVQYSRRNIVNQVVIPFGSYEVAKSLENASSTSEGCDAMVKKFRDSLMEIDWLRNIDPEYSFIGVGNSFLNAGKLYRKLRKYPVDIAHNYVMSNGQFDDVLKLIKTLEIDKTKKVKGISSERADIFAAGICMTKAIFDVCKFENLTVSERGMNLGFVLGNVISTEKPVSDLLGYSLDNISSFYEGEYSNSKQVGELALILFRQLKVLHKLPRGYTKILRIASAMHDCGQRIKFYEHEKNSFHILLNSEIYGVSHREIVMASFVSACQNLSDFDLAEWIKYKDILLEEDLDAMRKLALIVRLAEALDKSHRNVVQDVSCDILGDSVIMKTIVTMDASIEIRETAKIGQDFRKVYKKTLEVL